MTLRYLPVPVPWSLSTPDRISTKTDKSKLPHGLQSHIKPTLDCDLYEQKPKAIKSFGIRISPLLESANIKPQNIEKNFTPNIPAWCMKPPEILFDLHSGKKSESNPHILKDDFRKMQSRYKNYQQIYTDGSKEDSKVGCAVISDNHSNMQRIPCLFVCLFGSLRRINPCGSLASDGIKLNMMKMEKVKIYRIK